VTQSPPKPWVKGKQPTYTAFQLVVNICQDGDGNVWCDHDFASQADGELALGLQSGGAPQVAHALLTEAVRREVFLCALIELGKDPEYLAQWMAADEGNKQLIQSKLGYAARTTITKTLEKMVPGAVAEVLAMMADQG